MRAHDGILILALIVLAVAGCRKDERDESSSTIPQSEPSASTLRQDAPTDERTPAGQVSNEAPTPERIVADTERDQSDPATSPEESVEKLSEAREELNELADGAVSLRAALLGADFRDANNPRETPKEHSDERR